MGVKLGEREVKRNALPFKMNVSHIIKVTAGLVFKANLLIFVIWT